MNKYTIYTLEDSSGVAPFYHRWSASFSPLDEGETVISGHGSTEYAAIADLVNNHDLEPTK